MLLAGAIPYAGHMETYTADGVSFKMAFVPGRKTFPTGTDDSGVSSVWNAYWIGETEVTYELWSTVYTWAGTSGYTFAHAGTLGSSGSGSNQQPVTLINWRDSMIFCNALTEWYNAKKGTKYTCAYYSDSGYTTPIRTSTDTASVDPASGSEDNPYVKDNATGFRLLSSDEWELAARWRSDATNTVSGYTHPYFTKGDSASGAYTYYNDATDANPANGVVDGKDANDLVAVYGSYWNGSGWAVTGISGTAEVKSKGANGANSLGLYDMSGNVWEWCFDFISSTRVMRGGCWNFSFNADWLRIGWIVNGYSPFEEYNFIGFRLAKTE